ALNPGYSPAHLFLTAAYAMQDGIEEAHDAHAAYLRTNPAVKTTTLLRANDCAPTRRSTRYPCTARMPCRPIRSRWRSASGSMKACVAPECRKNEFPRKLFMPLRAQRMSASGPKRT